MDVKNKDMPLSALYDSEKTQPKTAPESIQEYEPTTWVDETEPDIDAEHLNHIEQGIKRVTDLSNATAESVNQLQDRVDAIEGGGEIPEGILTTKDLVNDLDAEVNPGGKAIDAALLPQIKQAIESGGGASPSGEYVYVEPDESEEDIPPVSEPILDADALGGQPASYYAPQSQITDAFSENVDYAAGQYCINHNILYKFIGSKPAGPWDESKVESCTVMGELGALNGDQNKITCYKTSPYTGNTSSNVTIGTLNLPAGKYIILTSGYCSIYGAACEQFSIGAEELGVIELTESKTLRFFPQTLGAVTWNLYQVIAIGI